MTNEQYCKKLTNSKKLLVWVLLDGTKISEFDLTKRLNTKEFKTAEVLKTETTNAEIQIYISL